MMKGEVKSAVDFVSNLLRCRNMEPGKLEAFRQKLHQVLANHYQNHWFPDKPTKGSGYRCIRIVNNKMDPLLDKAGAASGVSENELLSFLPSELTVWVDPSEVSYRIGEDGSIGVLFGDDVKEESDDEEEQQQQQQPSSIQDFSLPNYSDIRCCLGKQTQDGMSLVAAFVAS